MMPKSKERSHHTTHGCYIDIISGDFYQLELQCSDAIKFLLENYRHFQRSMEFGLLESEAPTLNFAIYTRIS